MKNRTSCRHVLVAIGALSLLPLGVAVAADSNGAPQVIVTGAPTAVPPPAVAPAPQAVAPARLPYGAEDVLKLSRAQVSDDIIQKYIQNTGTIYDLKPADIVYLRSEGVSDRVVNTMMEQRNRVSAMAAQNTPPPAPPGPAVPPYDTSAAAPAYNYAQAAPTDMQPQPTYVQQAPASSVYVIPYPQATSAYYGYPYSSYPYSYSYPYYGYYGGYYGPGISLGFGFGGGWGRYHSFGGHSYRGGGGFHGGGGSHHR